MSVLARLVREPIDAAALAAASPRDGAVCLFVGVVREENRGRAVVAIDYEAYEEMALPLLQEIGDETVRLHPVTEVRLVHRLGHLRVGEASVAVAVASPHRREAFAACRHAIDALKARVPIWKKEHYADGSAWLDEGPGEVEPVSADATTGRSAAGAARPVASAGRPRSSPAQPPIWNIARSRVETPSSRRCPVGFAPTAFSRISRTAAMPPPERSACFTSSSSSLSRHR